MHLIHFVYSIGAFIAPLVAVPFITGGDTANNATDFENVTNEAPEEVETPVHWAYVIMAIIVWLVSFAFLSYGIYERRLHIKAAKEKNQKHNGTATNKLPPQPSPEDEYVLIPPDDTRPPSLP